MSEKGDDPKAVAEAFAARYGAEGYKFDFSLESLRVEVDRFFDAPVLCSADVKEKWRAESELGAYVGETLARLFDGEWQGQFCAENSGMNFYVSRVQFGAFDFYPARFLGYRINNGTTEGTFAQYLKKTVPQIEARQPKN